MKHAHSIRGNALFMILIAIFLLGAVTAMLMRSSSTSEETGSSEKDQIAASELVRYAGSIQQAVNTLLLRGCSESQIEFKDPNTAITNPAKPADGSCSIFRVNGIGLNFRRDLDKYRVPAPWPYPGNPSQFHLMDQAIEGLGESPGPTPAYEKLDSIFIMTGIQKGICIEINRILGNTNPNGYPPRENTSSLEGGDWAYPFPSNVTNSLIIDTTGDELKGKKAGCYVTDDASGATNALDGTDYFYFYTVLIVR